MVSDDPMPMIPELAMDGSTFTAAPELLDVTHLSRQAMGDRSLMRDVLLMFRDHMRDLLNDLQTAPTAAIWRLASHTLKGTARTLGAAPLADVAARAEYCGRDEAWPDDSIRKRVLIELSAVAAATDRQIMAVLPQL
jgi:HPt (histidine-containing phosphotransfer) domain-containing protein